MTSRLARTDSETELDEKVRFKNPCNACRSLVQTGKVSGKTVNFELQKPGMESKNVSNAPSSSKVSKIRLNIKESISDDGFEVISSAFLVYLAGSHRCNACSDRHNAFLYYRQRHEGVVCRSKLETPYRKCQDNAQTQQRKRCVHQIFRVQKCHRCCKYIVKCHPADQPNHRIKDRTVNIEEINECPMMKRRRERCK
ncbi:hypothetical protein BJV77DRAFT_574029 [Russula vinacea]|nr:hypothetical protein BJV77DRAFT_574029 [Russula vinacea]